MGILEALAVIFAILKLTGFIDWAWWQVLIPIYISIAMYVIWIVIILVFHSKLFKEVK